MTSLFSDLDSEVVRKMRSRLEEMSAVLKKDRESGQSHDAVVRLSRIGL